MTNINRTKEMQTVQAQPKQVCPPQLCVPRLYIPRVCALVLVMITSGLGFNGGIVYGAPVNLSQTNRSQTLSSLKLAQSVDVDMDADDRDDDDDRNDNKPRRASTGRVNVTSNGCGASVQVGKISLATCMANRGATSALRSFNRTNRSNCRNSVSQSSTQSTTVNGVTRRVYQSNSTCQ
ncbi:MAG: hypothetical protein ACK5QS_00885 [Pseudanabaenaceae cyanobacterium]|jgi:hypothetical protein